METKNTIIWYVKAFAIMALIAGILFASIMYACNRRTTKQNDVYNGGIHAECGGHWEYSQAVGHYNSTNYLYICDNCKEMVEIDKYHK